MLVGEEENRAVRVCKLSSESRVTGCCCRVKRKKGTKPSGGQAYLSLRAAIPRRSYFHYLEVISTVYLAMLWLGFVAGQWRTRGCWG
jgi:hypothetical protein